jgi:hypothetical protein
MQLGYSMIDPKASAVGAAFFDETMRLWQTEKDTDSIMTVAAMAISTLGMCNGKDALGIEVIIEVVHMAERLCLIGVEDTNLVTEVFSQKSADYVRASAQTAWGLFNFLG